jgi:hypothetical protein
MQVSIDQAKEAVLGLGKALNDETFEIARRYVNDDMKYVGPFGSRWSRSISPGNRTPSSKIDSWDNFMVTRGVFG